MKRLHILVIILLLLCSYNLISLDLSRADDMIYRDLEYWQERGYIHHLPPLKPYSTQFVLELLESVIEKGRDRDRELANTYKEALSTKFNLNLIATAEMTMKNSDLGQSRAGASILSNGFIADRLTYWAQLSGSGIFRHEKGYYYTYKNSSPYGERIHYDFVEDSGKVAGISLMSGFHNMLSYNNDSGLYLNTGIYNSSFGTGSDDGIVISSEALQQAHFDLLWYRDNFSFTSSFMEIVGTDNTGGNKFTEKYLYMHSYNWFPTSWAELSFFESVMAGGRLEPLYLIPFSYLFYSQGFVSFADNSFMGLGARAELPYDLEWNGMIYTDDLGFNDLVKFDFDTKLKLSYETGLSWSPGYKWLRSIEGSYTAVMPYMYTHAIWHESKVGPDGINSAEQYNIDNYTHNGENLAVSLSPNSDRVELIFLINPKEKIYLDLKGTFIRHGNASVEGSQNLPDPDVNDEVPNDGSIFDTGIDEDGELYFQHANRFLSQDVLEKVLQLGFTLNAEIPMPAMDDKEHYRMKLLLNYTHEWIWNSGRDSSYGYEPVEGNDEQNQYVHVGIEFIF